jgi:hypothetical protein
MKLVVNLVPFLLFDCTSTKMYFTDVVFHFLTHRANNKTNIWNNFAIKQLIMSYPQSSLSNLVKCYTDNMESVCEVVRRNPRRAKAFPSSALVKQQPFPNNSPCFRLSGDNLNAINVTTSDMPHFPGMLWCVKGIVVHQDANTMCDFKNSIQMTSTEWLIPREYRMENNVSNAIVVDICKDSLLFMAKQVFHDEKNSGTLIEPTHLMEKGIAKCVKYCAPRSTVYLQVHASQNNEAFVKEKQEEQNEHQLHNAFRLLGDLISFSNELTYWQLVLIRKALKTCNTTNRVYGNQAKVKKNLEDLSVVTEWYNSSMSLETLVKRQDLLYMSDDNPRQSALYVLRSFCAFLFQRGNENLTVKIPTYKNGDTIDIELVPFPWNQLLFSSVLARFVHCEDSTNLCQFVEDRFPNFLNIMDSRGLFHIPGSFSALLGPDGEYAELPCQVAHFKKKVHNYRLYLF